MTDHFDPADELTAEELDALNQILDDESFWAEPSPGVGDRILAAITTAAGTTGTTTPTPLDQRSGAPDQQPAVPAQGPAVPGTPTGAPAAGNDQVAAPVDLGARRERRSQRRQVALWPMAAAAALVVVALAALTVINQSGDDAVFDEVALAPTEAAPDASAVARIDHRPNGERILLDISNLPPAPDGSFYTVWVIRPEPQSRVPAGSFHMRGGDAEIELWAGVSTSEYPIVSVTLNSLTDPAGDGTPVLRGQLEPATD